MDNKFIYDVDRPDMIVGYAGSDTNVVVPDNVKIIGNGAFEGCTSIENITLPRGLMLIGEKAFYGCSALSEIALPYPVFHVGTMAFAGCKNLCSVKMEERLESLGWALFSDAAPELEIVFGGTAEQFEKLTKVKLGTETVSSGDYYHPTATHFETHDIVTYGHLFANEAEQAFTCTVKCKADGKTLTYTSQNMNTWVETK